MSSNPQVKKAVIEFIQHNFLMNSTKLKFSDTDSFIEKGIIDSTGVLEMVGFLQDSFGIKIDDTELIPENLDTVQNITSFVERKQNSN